MYYNICTKINYTDNIIDYIHELEYIHENTIINIDNIIEYIHVL
jgi:hypothetical protein